MRHLDWKKAALITFVLFGSVPLVGCEKENSAGGVGKKVDNLVDPRGPLEKTGDKIDKAVK